MSLADRSWLRPDAVSTGRLPMTAIRRDPAECVSLDGDWSFTLLDRPGGEVRWQGTIAVPGCWTMQGVGDHPHYTNVQMPFPGPPPRVPDADPTGIYRRSLTVPEHWAGRRTVLHVGGAETVLYAAVDGHELGMGTDSRLAHEFDITDHAPPGVAVELELTVVRWGAATYLEDQDHWHHAGLHRSVLCYSLPAAHIADVHTVADWDPTTGDGRLEVRVVTGGTLPSGSSIRVRLDHEAVGETPARSEHPTDTTINAYVFEGRGGRVAVDVPGVEPWSAEHPRLHRVDVDLVGSDGTVLDSVAVRVGFRRVEVVGHELLVNGRAVLVKGVNRHDHDARTGKVVSREAMRRDVESMKAHHVNALRTSHYPNDPYLYEVCDELGMYVVDEANVESHAYQRSLTRSPEWAPSILERIIRMVARDRNHPSIVMWSLGNESGAAPVFDAAAAWIRATDPTRPIHYENGYFSDVLGGSTPVDAWRIRRTDSDVVAPMYPTVEDLEAWATTAPPERPLVMCEYAHAMGNSCGDLDRYWEAIRRHPGLQGGFVWDWTDQALVQRGPDGTERLAYGGDFGDQPNDATFCLNGLTAADRAPHPSLLEAAAVMAPVRFEWLGDGVVRVTNEHDFTDLADVADLDWRVTVDGLEVDGGTFGRIALEPGASTEVRLDPATTDPAGLGLTGWQIAHLAVACGDRGAAQFELGRSTERRSDGEPVVLPTRLAMWRAPIDNERVGPGHAERWRRWGLPDAHDHVDLRTEVDGSLVTHEVTVPDEWDDIPRVGVRLELPLDVASVEWVGRGPHENHTDRRASAVVGLWHTPIDEWGHRYVRPQANGNRTGVRSMRFLDADGREVLRLDELDDLDVTVSRWADEELDATSHDADLPAVERTYLWIDARHRGVGSAACGPDVSAPHRLGPGTYRWSYRLTRP